MVKRRTKRKNKKEKEKDEFSFLQLLGTGSFSSVHLCKMKESGEKFALKIVYKSVSELSPVHEVHILRKVSHENIVRFIKFTLNGILFIHMEYVEGKPLYVVVVEELIRLNTNHVIKIMTPLMSALKYLHGLKIIHGDVAPRNIIVKLNESREIEVLKLIDFGFACYENKLLNRDAILNDENAPELRFTDQYTCKIDIWSAGIVLLFLFKYKVPFFPEGLFSLSLDYNVLLPFIHPIFRSLIESMLDRNPYFRSPADDILDLLGEIQEDGTLEESSPLQEAIEELHYLFNNFS